MAGHFWLRLTLLCVGPAVTVILGNTALLLPASALSLAGIALDALRRRSLFLPFPVYLLLVYAVQTCALAALPLGGYEQEEFTGPGPRIETISVVIAAHNEHQYLKRTLDSIYERTPANVLKEVIVVDDASVPPLALEGYPQVTMLRHDERQGLIKSKTEGGNRATGDLIMFLDGHVKPEPNWWRPMLRHTNKNYRRVVVPVIPILNADTWEPNFHGVGVKMMFDWALRFHWFEDNNDLVPCMSGGLLGITRQWWHESGEYDYGMSMWGAENIEQSVRVWLCGGEIYVARDSRISHVFRTTFPYSVNTTEIYINKVRTVETWFDDYKERYYQADTGARQYVPSQGDISARLKLKETLHCKPFRWYVEKFKRVFTDNHMLFEVFLFRDTATSHCLQATAGHDGIEEAACDPGAREQQWIRHGEGLRNVAANRCIVLRSNLEKQADADVSLDFCSEYAQQAWSLQRGQIRWRDFCFRGGPKLKATKCGGFLLRSGDFEMHAHQVLTGPGEP